jgi:hypothetical protein
MQRLRHLRARAIVDFTCVDVRASDHKTIQLGLIRRKVRWQAAGSLLNTVYNNQK